MYINVAKLSDIKKGSATNAVIELADGHRHLILTRKAEVKSWDEFDEVNVFLNSCPHTGVRLDWKVGVFLTVDKAHLQCSTHGALFELDSGFCVAGPCINQCLVKLQTKVYDQAIYVNAHESIPTSAVTLNRPTRSSIKDS